MKSLNSQTEQALDAAEPQARHDASETQAILDGASVDSSPVDSTPQGKSSTSTGPQQPASVAVSRWTIVSQTVMLLSTIGIGCVLSTVATFGHASSTAIAASAAAGMAVGLATIPPLWMQGLGFQGAALPLAAVTWRLMVLLPALMAAGLWQGAARNCFLSSLLACYFLSLPLESWLMIQSIKTRDARTPPQ